MLSPGRPETLAFQQQYQAIRKEYIELRRIFTMKAICGREFVLFDELRRLLHEESDKLTNLYNSAHLSQEPHPPEYRTSELESCFRIFCILVELNRGHYFHLFRARGCKDEHLPISREQLAEIIPVEAGLADDFCDRFAEEQYHWCPIEFDFGMDKFYHDRISPICQRDEIKPYRGNQSPLGRDTTLWTIYVPEQFVSRRIQEKSNLGIEKIKIDIGRPDSQMGKGTYYKFALKQFPKSKKDVFENEKRVSGAVRGEDGIVQYICWFQSLERQPDDTYVECYNLVLEHGEHDLNTMIYRRAPPVSPQEYRGLWESMLHIACGLKSIHNLWIEGVDYSVCHGDIKPANILSVKGRLKLADPGEARIELRKADGQPRTAMTGGTRSYASPEKFRRFSSMTNDRDIVLVSDVWSLGCVFSVLATYAVLGKQGVLEYTRIRKSSPSNVEQSDSFHDGKDVLPEVTDWHTYLRAASRKTDTFTASILDIVDSDMLQADPRQRRDAASLCKIMSEKIHDHDYTPHLALPHTIEASLIRINDQELASEHSSVMIGGDSSSDETLRWPEDKREATIDAEKSFQSSDDALLSHSVLPSDFRYRSTTVRNIITSQGLPAAVDDEISRAKSCKDVTTLWNVRDDLTGKEKGLSGLTGKLLGRSKSVKEKMRLSRGDDELGGFFDMRDIVFLVDNSPSMTRHWSHAKFAVEVLCWRALGYDDDGMELYFTNPATRSCVSQSRNQKVEDFMDAMKSPDAFPDRHGTRCGIVEALQRIMTRYNEDLDQKTHWKSKTVMLLTDGIWKSVTDVDEFRVDNVIKSQLRHLQGKFKSREEELLAKRPFTIQFIRFGHDIKAIERLRRLDDELQNDGLPDLIDTEPVEGDVYKMFLGSISEQHDEEENYINLLSPAATSPSQQRFSFHSNENL